MLRKRIPIFLQRDGGAARCRAVIGGTGALRQSSAILLFKLTNPARARFQNCKTIALPGL